MGAKISPKSIKKGVQHGKASWHRFLSDLTGFWEASWGRKSTQNRPKKASKNDAKKKSNEIAKKVATRISNPARDPGSWVLGRSTPLSRAKPLRPPGSGRADSPFTPFTPSTPRHATTRYDTPRHASPRRLATPCHASQTDLGWILEANLASKIHQHR